MAYISQRGEYWRAEVRRRGYKPVYRTFDTKQQAQKWARHVEGEMDAGSFIDRSEAERTTLAEALGRYEPISALSDAVLLPEICRISQVSAGEQR